MTQSTFPFAVPAAVPAQPSASPEPRREAASRRAEASDAGTPFQRLAELAATNPREVLANPAFELAVVTEPGFLFRLPEQALCGLLRQPAFPPDLMLALAQRLGRLENRGSRVAARIAVHPNASPEALDLLVDEPIAALHANARTAFSEPWTDFLERITVPASRVHSRLLLHPGDGRVMAALARHGCIDGADPYTHRLLLRSAGSGNLARYLRAQRDLPEAHVREILGRDAQHAAGERREIAAMVRRACSSDSVERRLERVEFCGELTSRDDAAVLARSARMADRMRATMALGNRIPEERLRGLLVDRQWKVRSAMGLRPQLSNADAWTLARDAESRVRAHLARATPHADVLRHLAADPELCVQYAVVFNPACTPEIEAIAADPARILESLVAAWRAGAPLQGNGLPLGKAEASDAWTGEEAAILALRHSYDALPRVVFLAGRRCPVEVLQDHADSACWWARIAVARNPRTPRQVVEQLASGDCNWVVRAAAQARLQSGAGDRPLPLLVGEGGELPEPIPAELCSERHVTRESREELAALRAGLRGGNESELVRAIDRAFDHPVARRHLVAGMLVSRQRARLTGFSELGRKVPYELRPAAERRVGMLLGCAEPDGGVHRGTEAGAESAAA